MTYPSSDVNATNADAGTDSPATFRTDVLDLITKFNLLRNHVSTFLQGLLGSADAAAARGTLIAAKSGANADITSLTGITGGIAGPTAITGAAAGMALTNVASINGQGIGKNVLINGGFTINQRAYVSGAVLASTAYGHDRWKAGASGGNYTFTQLASNTQITIASGKSLIQVAEDKNVQATRYVLSWSGTAQARVGVNSSTPSGSYAASPIVITGQTAGSVMSVEFGPGTLGEAQCEATTGSLSTPFERRPYGVELALCERYARPFPGFVVGQAYTTSAAFYSFSTGTTMRAAPTASAGTYQTSNAVSTGITGTLTVNGMVGNTIRLDMAAVTGSPLIAGNVTVLSAPAGSMLTAEL